MLLECGGVLASLTYPTGIDYYSPCLQSTQCMGSWKSYTQSPINSIVPHPLSPGHILVAVYTGMCLLDGESLKEVWSTVHSQGQKVRLGHGTINCVPNDKDSADTYLNVFSFRLIRAHREKVIVATSKVSGNKHHSSSE